MPGERKRYLFDAVAVYFVLALVIMVLGAIILMVPSTHTYVTASGVDGAYFQAFLWMAAAATIVLVLGIFYNAMAWMEGRLSGEEKGLPRTRKLLLSCRKLLRATFAKGGARHAREFVADAFLLRKLWHVSRLRWLFHALILYGFVGTLALDILVVFAMDVMGLMSFMNYDGWGKLWIRDFGFELFGTMILIGLLAAMVRRVFARSKKVVTGQEDVASLMFLFIVILSGFVLEGIGMKSGIVGHESPGIYSFLGWGFSQVLPAVSIGTYGQLWLLHAAISVALIAYIPFSKLFHILASPLAVKIDIAIRERGGPR